MKLWLHGIAIAAVRMTVMGVAGGWSVLLLDPVKAIADSIVAALTSSLSEDSLSSRADDHDAVLAVNLCHLDSSVEWNMAIGALQRNCISSSRPRPVIAAAYGLPSPRIIPWECFDMFVDCSADDRFTTNSRRNARDLAIHEITHAIPNPIAVRMLRHLHALLSDDIAQYIERRETQICSDILRMKEAAIYCGLDAFDDRRAARLVAIATECALYDAVHDVFPERLPYLRDEQSAEALMTDALRCREDLVRASLSWSLSAEEAVMYAYPGDERTMNIWRDSALSILRSRN